MIQIWLDAQLNKFKVWNSQSADWVWITSLSELSAATFIKEGDDEICLYLPSQKILSLENELSLAQIKQLGESGQQFLFEDLSLMPVDSLNVRFMSNGVNRYFYALSDSEIEQWRQSTLLAGYKLVALLPDFLLIPAPDKDMQQQVVLCQLNANDWRIHASAVSSNPVDDGLLNQNPHSQTLPNKKLNNPGSARFLARFSEAQGVEVGHVSLLPRLLNHIEEIIYIDDDSLTHQQTNPDLPVLTNLNVLKSLADEMGIVITPALLPIAPVSNPVKHELNFIELKRSRLASPNLMLAAGIILMAALVQISADALQLYQYEKATTATQQATQQQFSSWFPDETLNSRVNVTAQVKPRLIADEIGQQKQLAVMSQVAPLVKQSQLVAESLQWNENSITLVVQGESRSGIDQLQQGLVDQGLTASLSTVTPTASNQVNGEIRISLEEGFQN